ncbi:CST complex subunit TEN1-like [Clupea harengus]|uniref:CST complex subunit TEN1 n=1 Tax=Clupea harengus TaxID=7950 RepID=A0A8M1KL16_CLUHA|nr:CST complex subunit TEN1-like [Clupea harengus]
MLPATAVYHFPWELKPSAIAEGTSVRTFGRLTCYRPEDSTAILSSHHASIKYQVSVQTSCVEPFNPLCGALYIVLGEIENTEEGSGVMLRARVMNCVDGVDLALLQKAINEQRSFFQKSEDNKGSTSG